MTNKPKIIAVIIAAALMLASGCSQRGGDSLQESADSPAALSPSAEGEVYSIRLTDSKIWRLDRDGNEIHMDSPDFIEITDLAGGEPRYQYARRYEDTGERDQWGDPVVRTLCALYDMDGNQLLDWEEMYYQPAFGEFIIRQDFRFGIVSADDLPEDYHTALYHVPTGEEVYLGAFTARELDGVFLLCDHWSTPMGVVDAQGNLVSGFPAPKTYYSASVANGYFVATTSHPYSDNWQNRREYLLDQNFQELYAFEWLSFYYSNLQDGLLMYQDGEEWGVLDPEKGILFSTTEGSIEYYDGDRIIVQSGSYRSDENPIIAALMDGDGEVIRGGFSWLVSAQGHRDQPSAEAFLGIVNDVVAMRIDRDGEVLASVEIPHIRSLNALTDSLYTYWVEDGDFYGEGLLDQDMNIIVPAGVYNYFTILSDYTTNDPVMTASGNILLQAEKEIGGSFGQPALTAYRTDIILPTGEVVVNNITAVYDIGPDRIAVERGFEVGLMDLEGNWITKRSIFHSLDND